MTLQDDIEKYTTEMLKDHSPTETRSLKVICDPCLGLSNFYKHEINAMDSPIIQRLRKIYQTGFAFPTYPSAGHNRFEHSLGVATIASKYAETLKIKHGCIDSNDIIELRLAGILHDCGHGTFSHLSEDIYKHFADVKTETLKDKFSKCTNTPHEIISYMIINSKAFKDFFEDDILKRFDYGVNPDMEKVADMIIGRIKDPSREGYKADIINGPFDADKLDYMMRDARFTGINMAIDTERIIYVSEIDIRPNHEKRLVFNVGGLHSLEQILFNKMLLFSSLYHHHKIRAAECMIRSIFEIIKDHPDEAGNLSFKKTTDFLKVNDGKILSLETKSDGLLYNHIKKINNRELLKRALVIAPFTVKSTGIPFVDFMKIGENPHIIRDLRELIVERLRDECSVYDLWVDLPSLPGFEEPPHAVIKITDDNYRRMDEDEIFHMSAWLQTYRASKWRGHVFCPPDPALRKKVGKVANEVLSDIYEVKLNDQAVTLAKIE